MSAEGQLVLEGLSTIAGSFRLGPVDLQVGAGEVLVVRFGPRARGDDCRPQLEELLTRFGLLDHADRRPRSLSGGERQRVALARALAGEPHLLLLDEPLSALDQPTREDLRGVLQDLLSELRIPAIHVTHDREEALILADDIAVIVSGQLRQLQPANEIASHPEDADVARILGWAELGTGTIQQGTVALGDLRLRTADESGTATVFYRPESISLAPTEPNSAFRLTRTIEQILPTVPLARVLLSGDPPITALVLQRDLNHLHARPGEPVEIDLPSHAVKTFTARTTSTQ